MMIVETEVRESSISGFGVFAKSFISKGDVVWRLDERFYLLLDDKDLPAAPAVMRQNLEIYGYPHMTRDGVYCCEVDNGRFMNHSEDPNTVFTNPEIAWATRDIAAGEEITCNYREFMPSFQGF